ncbi:MAG: ATP-binding protein [Acidimicrobiales bacterium]
MSGLDHEQTVGGDDAPASLAAAVLDEEARRQEAQAASTVTILQDDLLPGVGSEAMPLRDGVRAGGTKMLFVLTALVTFDEFDRAAMTVLAPDIQRTLGVSDGVLGAAAAAFGVMFVLGAIPLATLADRFPRTKVAAIATAVWSVVVLLTGFVVNAFSLFVARLGAGLGQSNVLPIHGPLLADTYPMAARGRIFALYSMGSPMGQLIAPAIVGAIAEVAGGEEGWRWAFFLIALPPAILALVTLTLPNPKRGRWEQESVLGQQLDDEAKPLPTSTTMAFARLRKIKTFYFMLVGLGVLGFALFSIPIFVSLHLEDEFGLSALERGTFFSLAFLPALIGIPFAGVLNDKLLRRSPARSLLLVAVLVLPLGPLVSLGMWMPNTILTFVFVALGISSSRIAFSAWGPVVAAVSPYRLRSQAFAMVGVYIFLLGAFFGAVLTGIISDAAGEPTALTIVTIPSSIIGAGLIAYGARHINHDISLVVEELKEEQEELQRVSDPDVEIPLLQVRNLDFSYGKVQVLFDVGFEVQRGEVLALLGTNGAGKSTVLRVVSGLGVPDRGVVRLEGRNITFCEAELRVGLGIVQVSGGKAVFGDLSVRENLRVGAFLERHDRDDVEARIERVLDIFPALREMQNQAAGSMSGGQQQQLAVAKALLLDPEVLVIDELSLGLAPLVVQELLEVVERLKAAGVTMIIVEQSLNVALALADRAIFMEKGQVKFDGPARELMERDDLVRAVFLGAEGG